MYYSIHIVQLFLQSNCQLRKKNYRVLSNNKYEFKNLQFKIAHDIFIYGQPTICKGIYLNKKGYNKSSKILKLKIQIHKLINVIM